VRCSALQCVAVRCSALQCVAVRRSALQCVVVRCSALQCVAVRCIVDKSKISVGLVGLHNIVMSSRFNSLLCHNPANVRV